MELENLGLAIILTVIAGLATGIGSAIAFLASHTNRKFLSFSLGFSAGVMIYLAFAEMLVEAKHSLTEVFGDTEGHIYTVIAFFVGIFVVALIDKLVPEAENPHGLQSVEDMNANGKKPSKAKLMRMGIFSAVVIAIHNFPEGIATFMSTIENPTIGIAIAFAIAIHNIPEGIAVSVPIYHATHSKKKAFFWSFMSGISEPIGALLTYFLLMPFMSAALMGGILAFVAGVMVYISLDELLPAARKYGEQHIAIYGLISGMLIMAVSLILLT